MSEEHFDIYGDLLDDALIQPLQEVIEKKSAKELEKFKSEQKLKDESESKINELESSNFKLKQNVSVLLATAKSEIERKDNQIRDLRKQLDELIFRKTKVNKTKTCDKFTQTDRVEFVNRNSTETNRNRDYTREKEKSRSSKSIDDVGKRRHSPQKSRSSRDDNHQHKKSSSREKSRSKSREKERSRKNSHEKKHKSPEKSHKIDKKHVNDKKKTRDKSRDNEDLRKVLLKKRTEADKEQSDIREKQTEAASKKKNDKTRTSPRKIRRIIISSEEDESSQKSSLTPLENVREEKIQTTADDAALVKVESKVTVSNVKQEVPVKDEVERDLSKIFSPEKHNPPSHASEEIAPAYEQIDETNHGSEMLKKLIGFENSILLNENVHEKVDESTLKSVEKENATGTDKINEINKSEETLEKINEINKSEETLEKINEINKSEEKAFENLQKEEKAFEVLQKVSKIETKEEICHKNQNEEAFSETTETKESEINENLQIEDKIDNKRVEKGETDKEIMIEPNIVTIDEKNNETSHIDENKSIETSPQSTKNESFDSTKENSVNNSLENGKHCKKKRKIVTTEVEEDGTVVFTLVRKKRKIK